jgi:hypothetical protein
MAADGDRAAGRFARGCRCFAVEVEGRIVTFGWLSTGREWIGELGVWIQPAAGEGYVWNCYTLEPFRRRGHYRSLLNGVVGLPQLRRLWIGSIEVPAEKADRDAGFEPVLHFRVSRIGPLRRLHVQPAPGTRLADEALERISVRAGSTVGLASPRVH